MELDNPLAASRYLGAHWGQWFRAAPLFFELGKAYEAMEEREKARDAYETFVIAFEDAEPEVQPMVEEARQALLRMMDALEGDEPGEGR